MMRRNVWLGIIALICAFAGLYNLKYAVAQRDAELARLDRALADTNEAIRVLHAEWAYLNRPQRLAELTERHLPPPAAEGLRMATLESLSRPERTAPVEVEVAALRARLISGDISVDERGR